MEATAGIFLVLVLYLNVHGLAPDKIPFPASLSFIKQVPGFDQYWNMYAPRPYNRDGWIVVPGKLVDGSEVDVWQRTRGAPSFEKPVDYVAEQAKNYRWRIYIRRMAVDSYSHYRLYFGRMLCRRWNSEAAQGEKLSTFDIYWVSQITPPPGGTPEFNTYKTWSHSCFAK